MDKEALGLLRKKLVDVIADIDSGELEKDVDGQLPDGQRLCSIQFLVEDVPLYPTRQLYICPDNIDEIIEERKAMASMSEMFSSH